MTPTKDLFGRLVSLIKNESLSKNNRHISHTTLRLRFGKFNSLRDSSIPEVLYKITWLRRKIYSEDWFLSLFFFAKHCRNFYSSVFLKLHTTSTIMHLLNSPLLLLLASAIVSPVLSKQYDFDQPYEYANPNVCFNENDAGNTCLVSVSKRLFYD